MLLVSYSSLVYPSGTFDLPIFILGITHIIFVEFRWKIMVHALRRWIFDQTKFDTPEIILSCVYWSQSGGKFTILDFGASKNSLKPGHHHILSSALLTISRGNPISVDILVFLLFSLFLKSPGEATRVHSFNKSNIHRARKRGWEMAWTSADDEWFCGVIDANKR